MSPEGLAIPELGVAPLTDPETDMEDHCLHLMILRLGVLLARRGLSSGGSSCASGRL